VPDHAARRRIRVSKKLIYQPHPKTNNKKQVLSMLSVSKSRTKAQKKDMSIFYH
jgi:hypothetical protein